MKPLQSTPPGAYILEGSTFAIFCLVSCSAPSRDVTLDPSFEPGEISVMTTVTQHCLPQSNLAGSLSMFTPPPEKDFRLYPESNCMVSNANRGQKPIVQFPFI